jgi:putative addiction module killer protein
MLELQESVEFTKWLRTLRDRAVKARIFTRLDRLREGNLGDVKPVGAGVSEMRISYGPGYRLYFVQHGAKVIVLLCGGDKSMQVKDIAKAKKIAATLE